MINKILGISLAYGKYNANTKTPNTLMGIKYITNAKINHWASVLHMENTKQIHK